MKKTIFLGIAALLALAVFSCNDVVAPGVEDSADGISLGVVDNTGRALTYDIAKAGTNFYEAAFQNASNDIIRTTWNYAQKGKIQIEPGTYTVIIMAGRNSDKTLLGIGAATAISGKIGTNPEDGDVTPADLEVIITSSTTAITFSVYPLLNDINKDTSVSTFLTDPTDSLPATLSTTKDELGNDVPIFLIDKDGTTDASWIFTVSASDKLGDFEKSIFVSANGTPEVFVTGYSTPGSLDVPKIVTTTYTGPAAGDDLTGGEITFSVTAPDSDGMVQIALEVPVVALGETAPDNPIVWYIRGGLSNGLIDAGISASLPAPSGVLGGAIVLGFGNLSSFPVVGLTPDWQP